MRVVIDTNVVFSGLYNLYGPPGRVLRAAALGRIILCAPETVRGELDRVLTRVLDYTPAERERLIERLHIEWIEEGVYAGRMSDARRLLRDPDDAPVLALAMAIGCDIVSGDDDLHAVNLEGIRVWRPRELVSRK